MKHVIDEFVIGPGELFPGFMIPLVFRSLDEGMTCIPITQKCPVI